VKRIAFRISGVGLLVISLAILGNGFARSLLRPPTFMALALVRVKLDSGSGSVRQLKAEMNQLLSTNLLLKVCKELNLASAYSDRYRSRWGTMDLRLSDKEALVLLKKRLDIRMLKTTPRTIQIRAFSENAEESAQIANALARGYSDLSAASQDIHSPGREFEVIAAEVPRRPVSFRDSLALAIMLAFLVASAGICVLILARRFPPLFQFVVSRWGKY